MAFISHTKAFAAQADFPVEAKIKVGQDIWTPGTAGARLYSEVLCKNPVTVQKAIDLAAKLEPPFTAKQVQGHLRWLYTAGQLEVDGKSYVVQAKPTKAKVETPNPKVETLHPKVDPKVEKPKAKAVAAPQERAGEDQEGRVTGRTHPVRIRKEILCRRGGGTVSVLTPPPKA
jgi:hypothetical protein